MADNISPLAPSGFPDLPLVSGVRLSVAETGVKYQDRDDLLIAAMDSTTTCAGVFTRSTAAGAAVDWCREHFHGQPGQSSMRGLIVNAGNANVFTGEAGQADVEKMARHTANILGCKPSQVMVASTGVIGEPLPMPLIDKGVHDIRERGFNASWKQAADAIVTTDTFAKGAGRRVRIGSSDVMICGIAKGSGMIEPNMATMLAFIFTDAAIDQSVLQKLLEQANERSFNAITVDSDTSTSDTCLLFATGAAGNSKPSDPESAQLEDFRQGLNDVMQDLALQVVRDGEGASKLIEIEVVGATDDVSAKLVAKSIANSLLVKTAIAGEDANWGRVVMAVGKSGVDYRNDALKISFGGIQITENGRRIASYDESKIDEHLVGKEILLGVDLGAGNGSATVWTCDLTHGYISINADYRS